MFATRMRVRIVQLIKHHFPTLWIEIGLRWRKRHFEPEIFLMPLLCNKNQIAIDVGANQGVYTYYMSKFAKEVVAFEPNVDLIAVLKKVANENVQLQAAALSNVHGDSMMRIDPTDHGLSTIEQRNDFHIANPAVTPVQRHVCTRTLDSFEFADVSFIKIDVEGHEEAVIQGARKTINRSKPVILVESEDQHNSGAPRRVSDMLAELGYRGFFVRDRGLYDFSELKATETDPRNYGTKIRYINNFIFVPAVDQDKISQLKVAARSLI
jgi:FkbM family methyltransferase